MATNTKTKKETTKPVVKKAATKEVVAATMSMEKAPKMTKGMAIDVFDTKGGKTSMTLPEAVFGVKVNTSLLAQAIRVYLANQRVGSAKTQTRGEVTGSTRKIYQQKGTGRARHGGIRAPLFVGGGVAHGPRLHDFSLSMPQKMRKAALFSALSSKKADNTIIVVSGLEKLEAKTKAVAQAMKKIGLAGKVMLVMPKEAEKGGNVTKAARNIDGVALTFVNQLHAYDVMNAKTILFMESAISYLEAIAKEK